MAKRIEVPESAVRTREQILDGMTLTKTTNGAVIVWTTCWNCGGSGRYPSSMTPPGQCRLYCWDKKTPKTYGKLPHDADKYVKRAQASDRKTFRDSAKWEAAPSKEKAIKVLRANTRVTDIVKVEDVTGPSELKELLRF